MRREQARRAVEARLDENGEESATRVLQRAFRLYSGACVGLAELSIAGRMRWRIQRDILDGLKRSKAGAELVNGRPSMREFDGVVTLFGLPVVQTDEAPGRWGLTLESGS